MKLLSQVERLSRGRSRSPVARWIFATLVTQENLDDPKVEFILDPSCEDPPPVTEQ